jgi:Conjugal transfer protein
MPVRWPVLLLIPAIVATSGFASAQSSERPVARTARTVVFHPRDLISLHARLHYTTLIVLPDGEDVIEATCGDKEFWIVNVRGSLVSVKPARTGGQTNLNVVTASGKLYAFVLAEVSGDKDADADLTVYIEPDDPAVAAASRANPQYVLASQLDDFKAQAALARDDARRATESAKAALESGMTSFRNSYPLGLAFPYQFKVGKAPFFVTAIFHDDHRTFIQARPSELPSLYELKDGRPNLVNFEVHDGTYVVPKILDSGYLTVGKKRFTFQRIDAR